VQTAIAPNQRRFDAIAAIHPLVMHSAMIADEVTVHLEIRARANADDNFIARIDADIATLRAAGADRRGLVELPRACFVEKIFGQERADGTEIHDVAGPRVVEPRLRMNPDECAIAAL
jgi:hypothetical protein